MSFVVQKHHVLMCQKETKKIAGKKKNRVAVIRFFFLKFKEWI